MVLYILAWLPISLQRSTLKNTALDSLGNTTVTCSVLFLSDGFAFWNEICYYQK